jgi:hypothetical protein
MHLCIGVTKSGAPCKKKGMCRWHRSDICAICLDEIPCKEIYVTECRHHYHSQCITTWYVTSDECPVCRTEQATDPFIFFKRKLRRAVEDVYSDAIHTLETENRLLRIRRARQNPNI